jgi:hypothetical protein
MRIKERKQKSRAAETEMSTKQLIVRKQINPLYYDMLKIKMKQKYVLNPNFF